MEYMKCMQIEVGKCVYEAKFHNSELVVVTSRNLLNFKIFSIKYLDIGRILNDNGTLGYFRMKMDNFYLSNRFYEDGKLYYSVIINGLFSYCVMYDSEGKCTLYRNNEEY